MFKIDRAFVSSLDKNDRDRAMVVTILNMAHVFKLSIVAEGVETVEQRDFLISKNCQILQGYYYSKPLTKEQFAAYYLKHMQ